jgi:hypothetical protein
MTKSAVCTMLIAGSLVVPVAAVAKGGPPAEPGKSGASHPVSQPAGSHKCKSHAVAYVASGALAADATLTQTAGAGTPDDTSDDRYSGTLSVTMKRINHHAAGATSPKSFTVSNIRLGHGLTATVPAGTLVKLIGKVTKVAKKCPDQSAAGAVTIRKAILHAAQKPAAQTPAAS